MTEKQYAPSAKDKKMAKEKMAKPVDAPVKKIETKKVVQEAESLKEKIEETPVKTDEKKVEEKKEIKKPVVKKIKRDFAVVNADNSRVSLKYAIEICRFIKSKRIGDAIRDLELVSQKRKVVPMRGEYAHQKGDGKLASGAGKFPVNASKAFIVLLKSLSGNSTANDMDEPYVAEAIANKAPKPAGRFGRWERKRCHIKLVSKEMKIDDKKVKGNTLKGINKK